MLTAAVFDGSASGETTAAPFVRGPESEKHQHDGPPPSGGSHAAGLPRDGCRRGDVVGHLPPAETRRGAPPQRSGDGRGREPLGRGQERWRSDPEAERPGGLVHPGNTSRLRPRGGCRRQPLYRGRRDPEAGCPGELVGGRHGRRRPRPGRRCWSPRGGCNGQPLRGGHPQQPGAGVYSLSLKLAPPPRALRSPPRGKQGVHAERSDGVCAIMVASWHDTEA